MLNNQTTQNQESVYDVDQIIKLAAEAGRIVLENGGETYRVEETINLVCQSFGIVNADSYVTPTGFFLSASGANGHTVSLIKRIRKRTTNLEKIALANQLTRNIKSQGLSPDLFEQQIREIDHSPIYKNFTNIISACFCAGCFSIVFGGNQYDFAVAFVIGGIIKAILIWLARFEVNGFINNVLGGAIAASLALLSDYIGLHVHTDKIIIGAVMLLVPGLAITTAILDTIAGDIVSGTARAVEAFIIAVAIAVGTGIGLKLWYLF
ncbi:MAG: threonine/serine exporter family protein [Bacteroidota bacterium]|nr:threonine/serine exporter family protein [Bacteroidota bacterium]